MTTAHTPGPWVIVGREIHDRPTQFDESGARIGSTPNLVAEVGFVGPFSSTEANLHLIAAAPDLLNALEVAEATLQRIAPNGDRATQGTRDVIAAAIAKARGQA